MADSGMGEARARRGQQGTEPQHLDEFIDGGRAKDPDSLDNVIDALKPVNEKPEETQLFNLRLPKGLHAQLKDVANATGRSMHDVVLALLEPGIRKAHARYSERDDS